MRRGFTLLELLIVIIIAGVLATLGLAQYSAVVEKSRGAEARQILGQMRSLCAGLFQQASTTADCTDANLGIGVSNDQVPGVAAANCRASHFFFYDGTAAAPNSITLVATRCIAGGKAPQGQAARTLTLTANLNTGISTWASTGGY